MQNELDIVRDVSARLDTEGIAYMLTGSMAMNYYAQPRMTRDIDLVQRIKIENFETWIVAKEDLILSKLFWAKDSRSESQMRDVKNLVSTGCDRPYIEQWTKELGLGNLWQEVSHE